MFEPPALDLAGLALPLDSAEAVDASPDAAAGPTGSPPTPGRAVPRISTLTGLDPAALDSDGDVLDLAVAWDRVATWAAARSAAAIAEFARRPAGSVLGGPGAGRAPLGAVARSHPDDEIAVAFGVSRPVAAGRLEVALRLASSLPVTARAFGSGRLDPVKTRAVVAETAHLPAAMAGEVEARVVDDRAAAQPPSRLRERLRRAVIAADPDGAERRAQRARAARTLSTAWQPDGMCDLIAHLPAADAAVITTAVDAAARQLRDAPDETRTLDQLRADCLVAPFAAALATGRLGGRDPIPLPRRNGEPATIRVTIPAAALLGLTETPAELAGYGPITAAEARRIAADARWQRLLTDEQGAVREVGRSYRPTAATRRLVETRDQRCRFPGCSAPAQRCDLDHVVAFPVGESTPENLVALCRRHHRIKHGHGDSDQAPTDLRDGGLRWRLPSGGEATTHPPTVNSTADNAALTAWLSHRSGSDAPPAGPPSSPTSGPAPTLPPEPESPSADPPEP
jgi:hypothetical protein